MLEKLPVVDMQKREDNAGLIRKNVKIYLGFGLFGIMCAVLYILIVPAQYEAVAVIQIQKVVVEKGLQPVESGNMVVTRLSMPPTYSQDVARACGVNKNYSEAMTNLVHAKLWTSQPDKIEIRVRRNSRELAEHCTAAVFEAVRQQEEMLAGTILENLKIDLAYANEKLGVRQVFLAKEGKSVSQGIVYLATREEVIYWRERIESLNIAISKTEGSSARLLLPVWSYSEPIFPKKIQTLFAGLLSSLILGWFYVWFKNFRVAMPSLRS